MNEFPIPPCQALEVEMTAEGAQPARETAAVMPSLPQGSPMLPLSPGPWLPPLSTLLSSPNTVI